MRRRRRGRRALAGRRGERCTRPGPAATRPRSSRRPQAPGQPGRVGIRAEIDPGEAVGAEILLEAPHEAGQAPEISGLRNEAARSSSSAPTARPPKGARHDELQERPIHALDAQDLEEGRLHGDRGRGTRPGTVTKISAGPAGRDQPPPGGRGDAHRPSPAGERDEPREDRARGSRGLVDARVHATRAPGPQGKVAREPRTSRAAASSQGSGIAAVAPRQARADEGGNTGRGVDHGGQRQSKARRRPRAGGRFVDGRIPPSPDASRRPRARAGA